MRLAAGLAAGLAAAAAGGTALNAVTYLDMAIRGRPSSSAPEDTVEALAAKAGVGVPGDAKTRNNRVAGLGPLTGLVAGLGVGAGFGVARALGLRLPVPVAGIIAASAAMVATDAPMAALGVTDPRAWTPADWVSDVVPHLIYGAVTAQVLDALQSR